MRQIMQKITILLRISLGPHHCCSIQSTNLHHNLFSNVFFIKISSFKTKQTFVRKTKIQTYSATTTSCQNNNLHIWKESQKLNFDNNSQVLNPLERCPIYCILSGVYLCRLSVKRKQQKVSSNISAPPSPRQPTDIGPCLFPLNSF